MTEDPEPAAAPHGFRSVLRLTWIFLGLALLIALPSFIFGDRFRLVEDDRQVGRRFLLLHLAQQLVEHAAEAPCTAPVGRGQRLSEGMGNCWIYVYAIPRSYRGLSDAMDQYWN
jgi:hypothetical protein